MYFRDGNKLKQLVPVGIFILVFGAIGVYLLSGSHAASPYATANADKGVLGGGAFSQADQTASDGHSIVFGTKSSGGGSGAVNCTTTLSAGANIANAVAVAHDGDNICLSSGNYPSFFVRDLLHSSYVTIEPAAGASPVLSGTNRIAHGTFLRFQGLKITAEFDVADGSSGASHDIQFINNDISGSSGPRFVQFGGTPIINITIQGNYIHDIDAVGACLPGGSASTSGQGVTLEGVDNVKVTNNIFKSIGWHFIQGGGGAVGVDVDHNLFTGPQPADDQACAHINVWQIFGGGNNDTFSNNVVVGSSSQGTTPVASNSLMFENGPAGSVCTTTMTNTKVINNLFADQNGSFEFQLMTTTNLTVTNNTIVGSAYGTLTARNDICGNSTNVTETNNVVTNNTNGSFNLGFGGCSGTCILDYNTSQDKTAGTLPGTTHQVSNWNPVWQNTSWSPSNFVPGGHYSPPAGYYQPVGLPFSVGYQGSIGP